MIYGYSMHMGYWYAGLWVDGLIDCVVLSGEW